MNQISQVFQYQEHPVRTVMIGVEPWFVANDVCAVLEIANSSDALKRLERDEVDSTEVTDSLGRSQKTSVVNEPGLYSLILGSRKPEARQFKRWVTHEVLPAIRKTGAYVTQNPEALKLRGMEAEAKLRNARARQARILYQMLDKHSSRLSDVAVEALAANITEVTTGTPLLTKPQVGKTYTAGEVGAMFGMSANAFGRFANANGLKVPEYGIYVLDKSPHSAKQVESWRYNQRAIDRARELLAVSQHN